LAFYHFTRQISLIIMLVLLSCSATESDTTGLHILLSIRDILSRSSR